MRATSRSANVTRASVTRCNNPIMAPVPDSWTGLAPIRLFVCAAGARVYGAIMQ
jgi:hypothetical protein